MKTRKENSFIAAIVIIRRIIIIDVNVIIIIMCPTLVSCSRTRSEVLAQHSSLTTV